MIERSIKRLSLRALVVDDELTSPTTEGRAARSLVQELGGTVNRVVVNNVTNETFYAKVIMSTDSRQVEVDSRPSDAIALALRARVPIFAPAFDISIDATSSSPLATSASATLSATSGRRAMAVAAEQEKIASIEQSRAAVVEAEADVPKAMADAFRSGRLGIMDYYKLRNVQADTDMRKSIAATGTK